MNVFLVVGETALGGACDDATIMIAGEEDVDVVDADRFEMWSKASKSLRMVPEFPVIAKLWACMLLRKMLRAVVLIVKCMMNVRRQDCDSILGGFAASSFGVAPQCCVMRGRAS